MTILEQMKEDYKKKITAVIVNSAQEIINKGETPTYEKIRKMNNWDRKQEGSAWRTAKISIRDVKRMFPNREELAITNKGIKTVDVGLCKAKKPRCADYRDKSPKEWFERLSEIMQTLKFYEGIDSRFKIVGLDNTGFYIKFEYNGHKGGVSAIKTMNPVWSKTPDLLPNKKKWYSSFGTHPTTAQGVLEKLVEMGKLV